jgi:hypothetical protein
MEEIGERRHLDPALLPGLEEDALLALGRIHLVFPPDGPVFRFVYMVSGGIASRPRFLPRRQASIAARPRVGRYAATLTRSGRGEDSPGPGRFIYYIV